MNSDEVTLPSTGTPDQAQARNNFALRNNAAAQLLGK